MIPSTCQRKTATASVWLSRSRAKRVARLLSARGSGKVTAFRCPECGLFHVGKRSRHDVLRGSYDG